MSRCAFLVFALVLGTPVVASANGSGSSDDVTLGEHTSAIVGGTDVAPGRWPDTVAVLGTKGVCSGTLIAPDVVLTAGHCANINPISVVANTTDYGEAGGSKVSIARTVAYPDWEHTYDVSVIVLATPINSVTPRAVGTSCSFNGFEPDTAVRLVGFGATDMDGVVTNTHLKEAMTAVTDPTCDGGNGCHPSVVPGGEFVAGGTGTADSCFGDSGGPVYLDTPRGTILVGAVSRGVSDSATPCGGGGIYVRTDKIVDWIEQTSGRTISKDDACTGDTYATQTPDGSDGDSGSDTGSDRAETTDDSAAGCNAAGTTPGAGSFVGALALLGLVALRRRR